MSKPVRVGIAGIIMAATWGWPWGIRSRDGRTI